MTRRTRLTGLMAAVAILAIVVGLPATLASLGSNPIPDSMPTLDQIRTALTSPDDGTLALAAVKVIAWAAWLFMTGSIAAEILARARGVRVPRLPGLHVPQAAAHGLVGAAILLFVAAPLSPVSRTATHPSPMTAQPTVATAARQAVPGAAAGSTVESAAGTPVPAAGRGTASTEQASVAHTVRRGETLWSIAEQHLGSGARYPELAELNRDVLGPDPGFLTVGEVLRLPAPRPLAGTIDQDAAPHTVTVHRGDTLSGIALEKLGRADRYPEILQASRDTGQPGGQRLRDPDLIQPGWKLTIPADGTATAAAPATASPAHRVVPGNRASTRRPDPGPAPAPPTGAHPDGSADHPQAPPAPPSTGAPVPSGNSPSQTPATASPTPRDQGVAQDTEHSQAPWMLAGLTGGGAMLAGAMLLVLRSRRRAQFRVRRPGRTIATSEPVLVPVERTLTAAGSTACADVELMDEVLLRLAAATGRDGASMPELAAVELAEHAVTLHLSAPAALEQPWQGSVDQLHWTLPAAADLPAVGPVVTDQPAPYPLLVTIGASDDGNVWLLNIEDLALSITGDPSFGRDFARYLAAEIACNPWSQGVRVDLVGVAQEVAPMNTDRIHVHTADAAGAVGRDPAAAALADAITVIDRCTEAGVDVSTARARQSGADPWPARMLLVDAAPPQHMDGAGTTEAGTSEAATSMDPTPALTRLLELVYQHDGQTGTSVVVHGEREGTPGLVLRVTADGRVSLPHAGLDLVAVGLTSDEAQGCAALLTQSEDLVDALMPVDQQATDGWRAWSDEAGSLREEHTVARHGASDDEAAVSVLEREDEDYLRGGATTAGDLDALAPKVPVRVRQAVADADPSLEEELAMWWAADCPLPRLTLLGPVWARARGIPPTKQKPYLTEVLAFLATRPHGATPEEVAERFNVSATKARDYVNRVRDWLGVNPRTGTPHLPDARKAPAALDRGVGVYQVLDLLVDADLFRRLRVRGVSRGPDGVEDLRQALRLVQGRPFDQLRLGGWSWLCEGDRLDQHMVCAIVDVAHLVSTYSLQAGDTQQARLAAETAALAAPDEEIPRLDLAAVAEAQGHHSEAARILRDQVCNRTDDGGLPPELSDRTQQVIASRDWQDRTRQAG
jgi:LysM repeat protein